MGKSALRAQGDFLNRIKLMLAVQSCLQKYFGFHTPQITSRTFRIPSHTEGRFAIVTDVGTGCGGRGSVLRAMGSQGGFSGIRERFPGALTRDAFRGRQNRVVLTPRRWRQVRGALLAQPGSDKTSLCGRRWQKSPVTGESST